VTPAFMVSYLRMMSKRQDFQPFYDAAAYDTVG
jgi:hypothetical protein